MLCNTVKGIIMENPKDNRNQNTEELLRQIKTLKEEVNEWQMRCLQAEQELDIAFRRENEPKPSLIKRLKEEVKKYEKLNLFLLGIKWRIKFGIKKAKKLRADYIRWNYSETAQAGCEFPGSGISKDIKISVLVPLYNTPKHFLKDMINSVLSQKYTNWELCLADGSDAEHQNVEKLCQEYATRDKRIKYQKLTDNRGISENTNECIAMSTGEYLALLDHDDILHPSALYEVMKAILYRKADFIYTDESAFHKNVRDAFQPHYKPDFSPDTLRSYNYISHLSVFKKSLLKKAGGGFRPEYDGSQDYDMMLRLTEAAGKIVHIPHILYYRRSHDHSAVSNLFAKLHTIEAAKKALSAHIERVGLRGRIEDSRIPSTYHIQYEIKGNPKISIIIPNKDHIEDLSKCISSIRDYSTWQNWEIIIVENNSTEEGTFKYYNEICDEENRISVVRWEKGFNYSAICNFGAQRATGQYLLMLNNDTEVITPDWMEQMLMFAQREDVGAVGAMLYYPDDTIQHAGVILGVGGIAGHSHRYFNRNDCGYAFRLSIAQNLTAVTAACMLIRKDIFDQTEGFDEGFAVALNDVDLCMKIRAARYLIVWTPYAELYHYESKSRGCDDTAEKIKIFEEERKRFGIKWEKELKAGDPYYNPNLTLDQEDFSIKNH